MATPSVQSVSEGVLPTGLQLQVSRAQYRSNRRILFINRFYYPDQSATAQILTDLAEHLASTGWDVTVLASKLSYSNPDERFEQKSIRRGVKIVRLRTTGFGRSNLFGRAFDYASFYVSCFMGVIRHARRNDLVIVKTDPPMLSVPVSLARRVKGAKQINWLQDMFPEIAGELGVAAARGWTGRLLKGLRNRSLRVARTNIVIGERMAERLVSEGVAKEKIRIIPNFTNDLEIRPAPGAGIELRKTWGYQNEDFIVGYSGNLGRAHEVKTMLDAADYLRDNSQIKFLFIGGGHLKRHVEIELQERSLTNVSFRPYQPRNMLAASLSVPNMHWISLQPQLEGLILPSKFYGVAAVGRPLCMIGDPDGDIGRIIAKHDIGYCFAPGESIALAKAILSLAADTKRQQSLGLAARKYIESHASREQAFRLWQEVLSGN